tara:strand:- start:760 stop:1302 length:543 start_codon:yes stop_codon:yes gene_type:complete
MAKGFYTQKITSGDKTQVTYDYNGYKSMTFTNTHSSAVSITLYVTSQLGTDITDTGVDVNLVAGYSITSDSQAIVVDGTSATSDMVLNERVYLSSGKLVGTCTAFTDANNITFGGGLVNSLSNNISLYTGTRYTMLNAVEIPAYAALQLHPEDFEFDTSSYNMYIDSSNASGYIDIISRY